MLWDGGRVARCNSNKFVIEAGDVRSWHDENGIFTWGFGILWIAGEGGMAMASVPMTIRMDEEEKRLISDYARAFGISASEFMRKSALERIEDELDLEDWKRAKAEFDADSEMVSAAGVAKKHL